MTPCRRLRLGARLGIGEDAIHRAQGIGGLGVDRARPEMRLEMRRQHDQPPRGHHRRDCRLGHRGHPDPWKMHEHVQTPKEPLHRDRVRVEIRQPRCPLDPLPQIARRSAQQAKISARPDRIERFDLLGRGRPLHIPRKAHAPVHHPAGHARPPRPLRQGHAGRAPILLGHGDRGVEIAQRGAHPSVRGCPGDRTELELEPRPDLRRVGLSVMNQRDLVGTDTCQRLHRRARRGGRVDQRKPRVHLGRALQDIGMPIAHAHPDVGGNSHPRPVLQMDHANRSPKRAECANVLRNTKPGVAPTRKVRQHDDITRQDHTTQLLSGHLFTSPSRCFHSLLFAFSHQMAD